MKKLTLIFLILFICHLANAQVKQENDSDNEAAANATKYYSSIYSEWPGSGKFHPSVKY